MWFLTDVYSDVLDFPSFSEIADEIFSLYQHVPIVGSSIELKESKLLLSRLYFQGC